MLMARAMALTALVATRRAVSMALWSLAPPRSAPGKTRALPPRWISMTYIFHLFNGYFGSAKMLQNMQQTSYIIPGLEAKESKKSSKLPKIDANIPNIGMLKGLKTCGAGGA